MTEKQRQRGDPEDETQQNEADIQRAPSGQGYLGKKPGAKAKGAIDGIGGTGGSSGTGAVRGVVRDVGDISGIDNPGTAGTRDVDDVAQIDQGQVGPSSGYQRGATGSDAMKGQTRGPNSETVPNPDEDEPDR